MAEPDNSQLLTSDLVQARNADGSAAASHPNFRPHLMQGRSPEFVPKLAEDVLAAHLIDINLPVASADAL